MRVFFLDIHQIVRLIESSTKLMVLLKKHMMLSLMKQMGLKMSDNLDDVGGTQLINAMKTMAVGEIKPKEDDDENSVVVIPSSSTLNEEDHQSQQNDETMDTHDQGTSRHSVPSNASTSNYQTVSRFIILL
jgi:hypothetical protein